LNTNIPDSGTDPGAGEAFQRALQGRIENGTALPLLVQALDRAAKDPSISALYITGNLRPEGYGSGYGALAELKAAIRRFKDGSGKPVIAYNQSWSKREYYLCSGAGTLYGNPFGQVDVSGPSAETMFMAGAFKKYGIEFQVTRVGKFKSAVEPFILEGMSEENRLQQKKLLDDLWLEWRNSVAGDRKRTPEELQRLADEKAVLTGAEAEEAGLLDKLAYYDEILDRLKNLAGKSGKDQDFPQIDLVDYAKLPVASEGRNRIAVVYAEGEIVDGDGDGGQVGGDRFSQEIRALRLDPDVKAIVLRVNSPGGSATASDLIQRELVQARKEKPVVVSMGTVAASGGYWISTYGDRIFAEPETITGSIGVFGLLPNVKKLANDHGITWDGVQTAKLALPSLSRPSTPAELARVQTLVDDIYDQFLQKVAEGRQLRKEDLQEIAQGRVWSGREALKLGLVDEMGGLQDAVRYAAKLAKVENDFRMDTPYPPPSTMEKVMKLLDRRSGRRVVRAGLGDQLKAALEGQIRFLNSLNDPRAVYARMPFDLSVR
ncbi:MAG TPA: signal peptide peptidase SppA, partial [Holophaga sp.]|nr:signal peptide peptidase SppA [Holophaga sp.]